MDTIELLNDVKHQPDLWDELSRDLSANMLLINFPLNSTTTFRLLGPFQLVKRLYVEYEGILLSKRECYDIATGDLKVYDIVRKRAEKYISQLPKHNEVNRNAATLSSSRGVTEANFMKYLEKLYNNPFWQKCLLINAWVKSAGNSYGDFGTGEDVRVCCLTQKICGSMLNRTTRLNELRSLQISGLFAHDVTVRREGVGLNTKYSMGFSDEPSYLDNAIVKTITSKGLWDFDTVVSHFNESSSKYLYQVSHKYRMPEELNSFMFPSYKENEGEHFTAVQEDIADLPDEAIEGKININNTIQSLEI